VNSNNCVWGDQQEGRKGKDRGIQRRAPGEGPFYPRRSECGTAKAPKEARYAEKWNKSSYKRYKYKVKVFSREVNLSSYSRLYIMSIRYNSTKYYYNKSFLLGLRLITFYNDNY
jgi:hypothetical protein